MARKDTFEEAVDFGSEVNKVAIFALVLGMLLGAAGTALTMVWMDQEKTECCIEDIINSED